MLAKDATTYAIVVRSSNPSNAILTYKSSSGYGGGVSLYFKNDEWIVSSQDHNFQIYGGGDVYETWIIGTGQKAYGYDSAQTFLTTSEHIIDMISLKCARFSNDYPSDTLTISIEATTDGKPNGVVLATATIAYNDVPTSFDWLVIPLVDTTPVVTTQAAAVPDPVANEHYQFADGHGTIVSGADITERGFEVKISKPSDTYDHIVHHIAGFRDSGDDMIKTETEEYNPITGEHLEIGAYTLELGQFPAYFYDQLFAGESYVYRAYATNDVGTGYGAWVAFSLGNFPVGTPVDSMLPLTPVMPSSGGDEFDSYPITLDDSIPVGFPDLYYPPWDYPFWDLPDWVYPPPLPYVDYPEIPMPEPWEPVLPPPIPVPDVPPYAPPDLPGRYGNFYYRKAYTKRQIDDLRRKCIAYTTDNIEYCLVLRHNVQVLRQFFNMMSDNIADRDEFNTFRDILPTQHLNDLYHRRLELNDFRAIINDFISNSVNNMGTINHNFDLIQAGLEDYMTSDSLNFANVMSRAKVINEDNPDVEVMKGVVSRLRREAKINFGVIMTNLNIVKATIT